MIEKAFVSGQIAQAIFKEDDKIFLIKAKDTENIMECTPYEESLFFNSDTEIKVFGNIAIEELRKTLVREKSNFDALYGAVGGFDPNLSKKARILSIQRAESLVKNPEIFAFVIFRLFGNPVPKTAALKEALRLSGQNDFWEMNFVYKRLLLNGDVIDYILSIFKNIILKLSLVKEFIIIKNIFITTGLFAKLFLNTIAKDEADLNKIVKIVKEFSDIAHIKEKISSISEILNYVEVRLKRKIIMDKIPAKYKRLNKTTIGMDVVARERQASYVKKEKAAEYPDTKKGVSFIKIRDPHDENKKGETDKPTTSKKQK